jgi:glutathione-regulated potassium-efflux system ancillary protein KefC
VLLAESEFKRELETDIEPFKGLLLGLFFIAVGMSIDFGVLAGAPLLMAGIVAGFMAVKAALIYPIGRAMGIPLQERPVFTLLLAQGGEFAFVVFQAAAGARVMTPETSSLLIGAVAVSMLLSPVLLVAIDKWLLPRWANCNVPQLDEISELQSAPIIIAGFGRYGQIMGRMLAAQGVGSTVLDHDADMIEAARAFGYKVFYGDATRLDLLRTAGAEGAKVLVVAVDDVDQSLAIVDLVHEHFPHLELVARARDVTHWNKLRDRGVMRVEREVFESSLRSARSVLEILGFAPGEARRQAMRFRRHNLQLFEQMHPHYQNRSKLISVVKEGRRQFEEQMAQERVEQAHRRRQGGEGPSWGEEPEEST